METQSKRVDLWCYKLTKYVITKNITCGPSAEETRICSQAIASKLETFLGGKLHVDNEIEQAKGHYSISHQAGNHKIWVFLYDTDNEHESETKGVTIMQPSDRIRRWDLPKPTLVELESALD